jgi:hypothetical protein
MWEFIVAHKGAITVYVLIAWIVDVMVSRQKEKNRDLTEEEKRLAVYMFYRE